MAESSDDLDVGQEERLSVSPAPGSTSPEDSKAQPAMKSRKRTKTGCLSKSHGLA